MEVYSDFMSIQKASMNLCVSRTQIYRLINHGILVKVAIGDKIMVKKASVERYLKLKQEVDKIKEEMLKPFPV